MNIVSFVLHGFVMADTYRRYDQVFEQEAANPLFFVLTSLALGLVVAIVFSKTRAAWSAGIKGGLTFGALAGLLPGFTNFYWPMVIAGFPYFLAWCWLGIDVIVFAVGGAVLALIIKPS